MAVFTNSFNYDTARKTGDKMKYTFHLKVYGDAFYNFRLELLASDELPTSVSMVDSFVLDSYDLNKWPTNRVLINNTLAVYDLDFWFSRSDTPLYYERLSCTKRRIEVVMHDTTHIKLIKTDAFIPRNIMYRLLSQEIKQLGYLHEETIYQHTGNFTTIRFNLADVPIDDKKIRFHIKDLSSVLGTIDASVGFDGIVIQHQLSYHDLVRDQCIIAKDICELYFKNIQFVILKFTLNKTPVCITTIVYKKINITTTENNILIEPLVDNISQSIVDTDIPVGACMRIMPPDGGRYIFDK